MGFRNGGILVRDLRLIACGQRIGALLIAAQGEMACDQQAPDQVREADKAKLHFQSPSRCRNTSVVPDSSGRRFRDRGNPLKMGMIPKDRWRGSEPDSIREIRAIRGQQSMGGATEGNRLTIRAERPTCLSLRPH